MAVSRSAAIALALLALAACAREEPVDDSAWDLDFVPVPIEGSPTEITDLAFLPDSSEFLALTRAGGVAHYRLDAAGAARLGSFQLPNVEPSWDCGLIAAAVDPDFARSHFVFFSTCMPQRAAGVLRVTFTPDDYEAIPGSVQIIVRAQAPRGTGQLHRIGGLGFEPDDDGTLWVAFGDMNHHLGSQDTTTALGSLIRLVPSREAAVGGHRPARGNAFARGEGAQALVYAWGFRMPWRGARDARGRYWLGDVGGWFGPDGVEEIDVVTAPGQNFGWPIEVGPGTVLQESLRGDEPMRAPIAHWGRNQDHPYILEDARADPEYLKSNLGRVAWVGAPYRRTTADRYAGRLYDRILYGDICAGFLRAIELDASGEVRFHRNVGHLPFVSGLAQAPDGYLYATGMGGCTTDRAGAGGALYRVELSWGADGNAGAAEPVRTPGSRPATPSG